MTADHGVLFAVRRCEIDYLAPAKLDDLLEVRTRIAEIRGASLIVEQRVQRGRTLVQGLVRLACMTSAGQAARIPPMIGNSLRQLAGDEQQ